MSRVSDVPHALLQTRADVEQLGAADLAPPGDPLRNRVVSALRVTSATGVPRTLPSSVIASSTASSGSTTIAPLKRTPAARAITRARDTSSVTGDPITWGR